MHIAWQGEVLCCSFCFLISFRLGGELNLSKPATTICTNVSNNALRVTRQILQDAKITFESIPPIMFSPRGQIIVSLDNVGQEKRNKRIKGLDSVNNKDSSPNPYSTATGSDSLPRFWHLPLPHIPPANQSKGKSQARPHNPTRLHQ